METQLPALGLYSNGVRGLEPGEFLAAAAAHRVPFVHLRGGPRGYGLAGIPADQVTALARQAACVVPVTLVTADVDLSDFASPQGTGWRQASAELASLARGALEFDAESVRILARTALSGAQWETLAIPHLAARHGVTVLIELHDPAWFTQEAADRLDELMSSRAGLGLLLDSGQVHDAWLQAPEARWRSLLDRLITRARVVHLSDREDGLDGHGHHLLADAAAARATTATTSKSPSSGPVPIADWRHAWPVTGLPSRGGSTRGAVQPALTPPERWHPARRCAVGPAASRPGTTHGSAESAPAF